MPLLEETKRVIDLLKLRPEPTAVGKALATAKDAQAARDAIGAGAVKTVNGVAPGPDGDVVITTSGSGSSGGSLTPVAGEPGLYTIGA